LPTAQNLRSAFPWGKKIKIKSRSKTKRGGLIADLTLEACAFTCELSLLAMAASQPIDIFLIHLEQTVGASLLAMAA
jgi:hypothetical protein